MRKLVCSKPKIEDRRCCRGESKYNFEFFGKWSPLTHPRYYPTHSTHWSNVIGASHSGDFSLYRIGDVASGGIRKMAEEGYIGIIERNLKLSESVSYILKTRAQWPAHVDNGSPLDGKVYFNPTKSLFSFTTMIGPSPDWFIGIDSLEMCNTTTCEWIPFYSEELYPLDAGTDDGISYLSQNKPLGKSRSIQPIRTSNSAQSPFYEGINSFGYFNLKLISTKNETGNEKVNCIYTDWAAWSGCSQTCGWGIRERARMSLSMLTGNRM